jgi:hypothetical protein
MLVRKSDFEQCFNITGKSRSMSGFFFNCGDKMASPKVTIETNEKPLDKNGLDELIRFSGYTVDMILQYVPEDSGSFLIYAKYHQNQIVRQVFTQRNTPRKFKDLHRAIDWGKKIGFRSVSLVVEYSTYPEPNS